MRRRVLETQDDDGVSRTQPSLAESDRVSRGPAPPRAEAPSSVETHSPAPESTHGGSDDADPLCGALLDGRYRIDRVVGSGGFGTVYAAFHIGLGARVAIKVPRLEGRSLDSAAEAIATFLEEGRTLKRLRHPNLVAALDVGLLAPDASGLARPYLVLEWCDGPNLKTWLARRAAPLDKPAAWTLFRPVVDAIAHAHADGIAHRDLKPANILLEERGEVLVPRVIDFGVAKTLGGAERDVPAATQTTSPRRAFTLQYAAPEQLTGVRTGPWTDVYALALVLVEIVRGRPVFPREGPGQSILDADLPTPRTLGLRLGAWNDVLARALAVKPADRFPDARSLLEALDATLDDGAALVPSRVDARRTGETVPTWDVSHGSAAPDRSSAPTARMGRARWVAMALALLVGAGVVYLLRGRGSEPVLRALAGTTSGWQASTATVLPSPSASPSAETEPGQDMRAASPPTTTQALRQGRPPAPPRAPAAGTRASSRPREPLF